MNIGIDIGGRHIGFGLIDKKGNTYEKQIVDLDNKNLNVEYILSKLNQYIQTFEEEADCVGIGIPGFASDSRIQYTCNMPLTHVDLKEYIKTRLPIYVANDADCAAIAEFHYVDNKMYSDYALITIGTGVGAGLILNGRLQNGATGCARRNWTYDY